MQSTTDHRVFERFQARFPVRFFHSRGEFGRDVFLRDASAQGAKITCRKKLFRKDSVSLEVKLPDNEDPLVLNGSVVWSQARDPQWWEAGITFHKINLMKMRRMFDLVNENF